MSNKLSVLDYLRRFSGWITGIVTFLTTLVGFILLFQDNPQLMLLVVLVIISIAGMIACIRIVAEKTPPLIIGGKGLPKYPRLRKLGFVGIISIPIFNMVFFSSIYGGEITHVALNGTPTFAPVSPTATQIPKIESIIKIKSKINFSCASWYVIPSGVDLNQDPFKLMEGFYNQEMWSNSIRLGVNGYSYSYFVDITNTGNSDEVIKINNEVYAVLESYEPLEHLNVAIFGVNGSIPIGGGCGGGEIAFRFHDVGITNQPDIVAKSKEFDYFTLKPNEILEFNIPYYCKEAGLYKFHLEINMGYLGVEEKISVSPSTIIYCPSTVSEWGGTNFGSFGTSEYKPHTVFYNEYKLIKGLEENNNETLYQNLQLGKKWVITKPWTPCSNAPESYLFQNYTLLSSGAVINPALSTSVDVYSTPSLTSTAVDKLEPKKWVRFGDYQCSDGMVWWNVFWDDVENGQLIKSHDVWIPESNGITHFLLSCVDNPDCDTNGN